MIRLFIIGDGPRDHSIVSALSERVLGVPVHHQFNHWARLHQLGAGKGYRRKLRFAVLQAKDAKAQGLVATVDTDKDPKRQKLRELSKAREEDRAAHPPFPTALGEAVPHAEVWLLDDRVAVVRALRLPADFAVPNVREVKNPKNLLEEIKNQSQRAEDPILEVLADIATLVDPSRCVHASETGFRGLLNEIRAELLPLVG